VIPCSRIECNRCVTRRAIRRRECGSSRGMRRGIRCLPVGEMTTGSAASSRRDIQRIVVVDVAQIASHCGMTIGQWKSSRVVVENSGRPCRDRMARGAGRSCGWKPSRDVVRYGPANRRGTDKRCLVAAIAISRAQRVIVIDVAGGAGRRRRRHVRAGQRESSHAVIE